MIAHKNRVPDSQRVELDTFKSMYRYENGRFIRLFGGRVKKKVGNIKSTGYARLKVKGKEYFMHHLVWFYHKNYWPIEIDHIDRDKLNNRIENLRECSRSENQKNRSISKKRGVL